MKKIISIVVTIFFIVILLVKVQGVEAANFISENKMSNNVSIDDISGKLIRFHVIANSDSEKDQNLKLKVRDKVLEYVQPLLKDSKNIEESREILNRENEKVLEIAREVIKENGYDYSVESTLDKENFPVKTYGNITLPQGEYEAYRIIIGTGEGQNWWCVMFPPICFVDITKGEVAYEETEEEMKKVLDDEEFNMVDNTNSENVSSEKIEEIKEVSDALADNTEDDNIVIKFKIEDILKNLFK
ncbi:MULTISPECIES: stage II sporulation protein R [unclassified Clostridium]|uniref:stage II sporulation protein R n=1 Tax=unclassified Clostridium TaxID=2614128 RepID=UPI003217CC6B